MAREKSPKVTEEVVTEDQEDQDLYAVATVRRPKATAPAEKGAAGLVVAAGPVPDEDETPYHKIDFISDVPLRLSVEIGQTTKTVREILSLNEGSIVEFTKVVGEPMDITISGRLMARGEIVVVNERYGVRISEVTRPDETGPSTQDT
jgi:flagellar motor switch protein FliN/FliY